MPNDATRDAPAPLLLTAAQVAAELQVSREYVYRLFGATDDTRLPSIVLKGSRARRVRRADLEAWIADQPAQPDRAA